MNVYPEKHRISMISPMNSFAAPFLPDSFMNTEAI
jgi:hypothetical protein